jgi:hypothetical protein
VIDEPPVAPAVNDKVPVVPVPPSVKVPIVGACGTVVAVIEAEADDAGPVALLLVPVTAKVYDVPEARPVTVTGLDVPVPVNEPGVDVAVYEEALPPVVDAVNATVAAPLLYALEVPTLVAVPIVGASGTSGICVPGTLMLEPRRSAIVLSL